MTMPPVPAIVMSPGMVANTEVSSLLCPQDSVATEGLLCLVEAAAVPANP